MLSHSPKDEGRTTSLIKKTYLISMGILSACISLHTCMNGDCRSWKKAVDPLELELQMFVSCHVGAGD